MEALRPIDYDELTEAADLLQTFRVYWEKCAETSEPDKARQQLIGKLVDRVFVEDGRL